VTATFYGFGLFAGLRAIIAFLATLAILRFLCVLLAVFFLVVFFRDPEREIPLLPGAVVFSRATEE